tara:strand:+ start:1497 stop:1613 length:117 start_codon:yes stop_codon:yes gene_type:complete
MKIITKIIKNFFLRIKNFFSKKKKKEDDTDQNDIYPLW